VVSADVLVALRSLDEGRTVVRELRESGHTVACVRNPFRALDELRVRPRDALITDIDLWVDDGALLFDRLHSAGASTHVIFIGDDASTLAERARRSGADAAIARPWSSGDVQARLRDLLCAVSSPSSDDSRSPGAGGNEGDFDDSRPWLRFFFDARRELRETVEPSERLAVLVDLVLTRLDADAVVEMAETSRGPRVVVHTNRNGTVDVSERVAERVRELLSAPIPPDPVLDTRGAIFLPLAQGRGSISIELSRPLPASIEDFVQELGIVFREELARD
jgi:CheY-like chemotaxis protein